MNEYYFSVFSGGVLNVTDAFTSPLSQVANVIRSGLFKEQTEAARQFLKAGEKDAYKRIKLGLDTAVFACECARRRTSSVKRHSGLMVLDYDDMDEDMIGSVTQLMQADTVLGTVLMFRSPSGRGLKQVIRIPLRQEISDTLSLRERETETSKLSERHRRYYEAVAAYIKERYGIALDTAGKDLIRGCQLCHDEEAYYNPDAPVSMVDVDKYAPRQERNVTTYVSSADQQYVQVAEVVRRISLQRANLCERFEDWVTISLALSELGEAGRPLFHQLAMASTKYRQSDTDRQYTYALKHRNGKIGLGTFFAKAEKEAYVDLKDCFFACK